MEYKIDVDVTKEAVLKLFPEARALPVIAVDGKRITEVEQFKLLLENG